MENIALHQLKIENNREISIKLFEYLQKLILITIKRLMLLFKVFQGNSRHQRLLEEIHKITLMGMNYGWGTEVSQSGELIVLKILRSIYRNHPLIIFDVGANIGDYTTEVLKTFGNSVKVYAFEPSSISFKKLKENLNGINVELFNLGLSDRNETRALYVEGVSGGGTVYNRRLDHIGVKMDKIEDIELRKLDDFCKENVINRINLLKMDIEGHEIAALNGAREMLESGSIDFVQFEFGGCNIDSHTYFQDFFYLLNPRYRIYRIIKSGLVEISLYKETYEIFTTTNYLAISRDLEISPRLRTLFY
ncbi:MAG: FkbM family methyltransferase [Candidatus Odinarchaeota archaeon]